MNTKMRKIITYFIALLMSLAVAMPVAGETPHSEEKYPDLLSDEIGGKYVPGEEEVRINDPLEPLNRVFFEFNDVLYEWVIKPVTDG